MSTVNWEALDLGAFASELRTEDGGPEGEKTIWAFEEALRIARLDEALLRHMLVAFVCLLARVNEATPRDILEAFFRRSVTDEEWREVYRPLLG